MAVSVAFSDRVRDTSTTTGTGAFTLSGTAPSGYQTFNAAFGVGPSFYYVIQDQSGTNWEVGIGSLSGTTTLSRDTPLNGSAGASTAVSFGAGTKDVWCDLAADLAQDLKPVGRLLAMTRGNFNP